MRTSIPFIMLILVLFLLQAGCIAPEGYPDTRLPSSSVTNLTDSGFMDQFPVRTARVDDIDIAYRDIGKGEPLVLIIGYGSTMDLWPPGLLRNLSAKYRVIVFDNRGMGRTTTSGKPFSLGLFADDTAELMAALNISRADVLGWSMGADIAQELALRHPEKVDRLILYAGSVGGSEEIQPAPEVLGQLSNTSGTAQEVGQRLFPLLFPAGWLREHPDPRAYFPIPTEFSPPEAFSRQIGAIVAWNGTYSRLPDIRSPTRRWPGPRTQSLPRRTPSSSAVESPVPGLSRSRTAGME